MTMVRPASGNSVDPDVLVPEKDVVAYSALSRSTLWQLRAAVLAFLSIGRQVRYDLADVRAWLRSRPSQTDLWDAPEPVVTAESQKLVSDHVTTLNLEACHWSLGV